MLSRLRSFVDFSVNLRAYVRDTVSEEELRHVLLEQQQNRERNFLEGLRNGVFANPGSPYNFLFEQAGLDYPDVEALLEQYGLEQALERLYEVGVYLSFDEFKGRVPVRRGGREFSPHERDFDNLNLSSVIQGQSGGSTGVATRSRMDLEHIAQNAKQAGLCLGVHGIYDAPKLIWWGLLPDPMGLMSSLSPAHLGHRVRRWFTTFGGNESNTGWRYVVVTYLVMLLARLHGLRIPMPRSVSMDDPLPIAQALSEEVAANGKAFMVTAVSKCLRISLAARARGIRLEGVTFLGSSEPVTPAKVDAITASGAKFISIYAATETGHIGLPCARPADETDVHFMSNNLAMIRRRKDVHDREVDVFCFSSLLPTNPKLLINVELDDFGIVETRNCGCPLQQMGFTTHIRQVASYSKLTGEGMTLIGSDMERILEWDLPARFGGSPLDYQLVEEETAEGITRLMLYVDPAVPVENEAELLEQFLQAMRHNMPAIRLAQAEYRSAGLVKIRRAKPLLTPRGKHFPIRTLGSSG